MKLIICVGSCCYSKGAQDVIDYIELKHPDIKIEGAFCLGTCSQGVSVSYNDEIFNIIHPEEIEKIIKEKQ